MMFKMLEGDTAILVQNGVYKVADLATRNGFLFAKLGSGYVRLYANGTTSKDGIRIDALSTEKTLFRDRLSRLCDGSVTGAEPVETEKLLALTNG